MLFFGDIFFYLFHPVVDFYDHVKYINRWGKRKSPKLNHRLMIVTNKNAGSFLWLLVCLLFFVLRLPSISNPTWEIDIFHLQWRCIYIKYIWYIFFPGLIDWFFLLLPRCCLTIFTEFRLLQLLGSFLWYMLSHVANHKSYNIGRISFYIESKTMRDRAACTRGK